MSEQSERSHNSQLTVNQQSYTGSLDDKQRAIKYEQNIEGKNVKLIFIGVLGPAKSFKAMNWSGPGCCSLVNLMIVCMMLNNVCLCILNNVSLANKKIYQIHMNIL